MKKDTRQLLCEWFPLSNSQYLSESHLNEREQKYAAKGGRFLKGVCQRADVKNGNGRIYPRNILEREIKKYQQAIENRSSTGELDHPDDSVVNLKNISHMITELWWDNNDVWCKLVVFDNPKIPSGQILAGLIEEGVRLGISSRSLGTISENRDGTSIVQEDLSLICFDMVSEPSTQGAWQVPDFRPSRRTQSVSRKFTLGEDETDIYKYLNKESKIQHAISEILKG